MRTRFTPQGNLAVVIFKPRAKSASRAQPACPKEAAEAPPAQHRAALSPPRLQPRSARPGPASLTDFAVPGAERGHHVLLGGRQQLLGALRGLQGGELQLPHVLLPPAGTQDAGPVRRTEGRATPGGTPQALTSRISPLGPHRQQRPEAPAAAAAPTAPPPWQQPPSSRRAPPQETGALTPP